MRFAALPFASANTWSPGFYQLQLSALKSFACFNYMYRAKAKFFYDRIFSKPGVYASTAAKSEGF